MKRHSIYIQIIDYKRIFSVKNILDLKKFDDYEIRLSYNSSADQQGEFIFSKENPCHRIWLHPEEEIYFSIQNAIYIQKSIRKSLHLLEKEFIKAANDYGVILLTFMLEG